VIERRCGTRISCPTTFTSTIRNSRFSSSPARTWREVTVLRQAALTVLMAQMGSFVPASQATIGV